MKKRQNDKTSNFSYYICIYSIPPILTVITQMNVSTLAILNTSYIKNAYFQTKILNFLSKTK